MSKVPAKNSELWVTNWYYSPGCVQQGECLIQHLEVCKGGTTRAGYMTEVPAATLARFMEGSCGVSCPSGPTYGHSGGSGGGNPDPNVTVTTTTDTTTSTTITTTTSTTIMTMVE